MADGWLFRLRSTLGARHAVPAWPASAATDDAPAELSPQWPALRDPDADATEALARAGDLPAKDAVR